MIPSERQARIVELLSRRGRASVEELAATLAASRETIRRDLATLDGRGLARRVHGGAVRREDGGAPLEGPFARRRLENVEAKRAVARAAAATLRPGDSLFVDTGTTTLHFADELARVEGLTVVTNSAAIAERAGRARGSAVYLLGGEFRAEARETVGAMTLAQIGELRAAHAFLTVASIDVRGFMDIDLQEAQVARAMIERASAVTVLSDAAKLGRPGVFEVAPPSGVDRLVIDAVGDPERAAFEAAGMTIVLAPLA